LCKHGFYRRNVLAVGEGPTLRMLIDSIERLPELGVRLVGVVTAADAPARDFANKRVLGSYGEISSVLQAERVDEVLIALPGDSRVLDQLLRDLKDETLYVRVVPDVSQHVTLGCEVEDFDGLPIVRLNDSPVIGWGAAAKRATDVIASAVALVVLSPLLLVIALVVKLTSPGPVLYVQERMGLDGRSFHMLKFRSMRVDAERQSGAVWARKGDDRRTSIGTFLRQTSLDELPQLWNVLCGDMSLVGPRPERPVFVHKFRTEIPHYMLRHKVRAGITGWAQVNGWRGNTSLDRRIECDLFYIRNWSYALDLKILTMTLWKGFIDKNAY
jgi:Undecaprenyl-phosphate glucose phosphotransferase